MKFMDYVKAVRIEEQALEYQKRGYKVVLAPIDVSYPFETRPQSYDIVAIKDDHKLAYRVIAFPKLGREVRKIAALRQQAYSEGFDEFRLVVVREPRQFPITVQGIEEELTTYLRENMLSELVALSDEVRVKLVKKVTISSISLKPEGYRVAGDGLLIMDIYYNEEGERFWEDDDFPLDFFVTVDHQLKLKQVHEIAVDTSHFWQY